MGRAVGQRLTLARRYYCFSEQVLFGRQGGRHCGRMPISVVSDSGHSSPPLTTGCGVSGFDQQLQEKGDRMTAESNQFAVLCCRQAVGLQQYTRCYGLPQTHLQLSEDRHPCQLGTLAPSAISLRLGVTRAALDPSSCSGFWVALAGWLAGTHGTWAGYLAGRLAGYCTAAR